MNVVFFKTIDMKADVTDTLKALWMMFYWKNASFHAESVSLCRWEVSLL